MNKGIYWELMAYAFIMLSLAEGIVIVKLIMMLLEK